MIADDLVVKRVEVDGGGNHCGGECEGSSGGRGGGGGDDRGTDFDESDEGRVKTEPMNHRKKNIL